MLQTTLDRYMIDEGVTRYNNVVQKARERGEESSTKYGKRLLSTFLLPFSDKLKAWITEMGEKRGGTRGLAYEPLKAVTAEVAAFVAARGILDCIGLAKEFTSAAIFVGNLIEDELRFAWLQEKHPALFRKLEKQLAHCSSYDHKRGVIIHAMTKFGLAEPKRVSTKTDRKPLEEDHFKPWSKATCLKIGALLIDLFEDSTQLVETYTAYRGRGECLMLAATKTTTEWIRGFNEYHEVLDPVWLPMVEPPAPWASPTDGGYTNDMLPTLPLVKRAPKGYIEDHLAKADMPEVYETINALQNTAWKINTRVQGVLAHYWDLGRAVGGLPPSDDIPLPEKPEDIATNEEARKTWRSRAARVHKSNAALHSTRLQARKLLNLAQKFANTERFYYPYQLDFRGRVYTVPTFLTPQGSDIARSLLLFADGVPMMDDTDAYWLAVYGANLFGKDKITFEERVAWVQTQRDNVLAVAKDPLACQWWQEADEPWQFLAWCFEWAGWLTVGAGFKTHLPVCLDGTNNGLQILSMLTRDEVAAKATNVLPSPTPADIYGDVAKRVVELMQTEADATVKPIADYWLAFGINRKTTKRPVMVLPYGGTFHSCREYVADWYKEAAKAKGEELPEFTLMAARCQYLSSRIWEAIEFCVGRPRQAMAWLQQVALILTDAELPISWTAPSGFPVLQDYKEFKVHRVLTTLGDSVITPRLNEETSKLSRARQKNGISPNFVHSCDGAALVKTVARCLKLGISQFAMIHDSYGTHAPKVHEMASALRCAFVEIFTEDQLNRLRSQLQQQLIDAGHPELILPPVPEFGSLDISKLHESEFFFA